MIIVGIIITILFVICIYLGLLLHKKVELDKQTQLLNEQLKREKSKLVIDKEVIRKEILVGEQTRTRLDNELRQLRSHISETISENTDITNKAFQEYEKILENKYTEIENEFDDARMALLVQLDEIQKELNKLKATRAAAHEALLKEQTVKDNKDNYKLTPSSADLSDARRLEIVKRELNKPRILSMLIWQTFWQPLAKKQFPLILQAKTKCGIYKITNLITDECYIGQSVDIYKRWNDHCKCGLGIDTPPGNKLYKAIQEYGLENFTFELLIECSQSELNEKEKYFIELYQANDFGYNSTGGNK